MAKNPLIPSRIRKGRSFNEYAIASSAIPVMMAQAAIKRDAKAAEERSRWLASFPEMNPDPIIELDAGGCVTYANPATRSILMDLELPDDPGLFTEGAVISALGAVMVTSYLSSSLRGQALGIIAILLGMHILPQQAHVAPKAKNDPGYC